MKLKQQISPSQYRRMQLHPEALITHTYYLQKHEPKVAKQSFLVDNYLFAEVQCKKSKQTTFVKYLVVEDSPRKDSVAFHVIGKLWAF